ncbi:PKD domain-containing protein [Thermococcus sp.]
MSGSFAKKLVVLALSLLIFQFPMAFALSLPHSIFYGEKQAIDDETNVVPAYISQIKYSEEDLRKEIELKYSYNLDDFIALLKSDPVEIFWYIRNNFDYEPYYGSLKGPLGTFLQRGGNDLDLASLLIEIYRQLGIPARYVRGNIILSGEQLQRWFGTDDVERVLRTGMIPYEKTSGGYIIEHFWVEAYLDGKWVPLDPSFKEYEYKPPELNLTSLGNEFAGDVLNSSVSYGDSFFLKESIEASPALSGDRMEDIAGRIVREIGVRYIGNTSNQSIYRTLKGLSEYEKAVFGTWEIIESHEGFGELPFRVRNVVGEFSQILEEFRYRIEVSLEGYSMRALLSLSNISTKRVTLSWLPSTEEDASELERYESISEIPVDSVNITPVLMVDGVPVSFGRISHLGVKTNLTVTMVFGNTTLYNGSTVVTLGGYYAISVNSFRVTQQFLGYRANRLRITDFMLKNGFTNITTDEILGEMLNLAGLRYWSRLDEYADRVASRLGIRWLRVPSVAVIGTSYRVKNGRLQLLGMFVDVQKDLYMPIAMDGDPAKERTFMLATGVRGSELEAEVLREYFNAPAISTATIFRLAYESGIPIYRVNSTNADSIIPMLSISQEDRDRIRKYVSQGYEVYVPGSNVLINGWNGTGYYIVDPETGAMGYMISSGIRGGLSFGDWIKSLMQDAAMSLFEKLGFVARLGEKLAERVTGAVSVLVSAVMATVEAVAACLELHPCQCGSLIQEKIVEVSVDGVIVVLTISLGLSTLTGGLSFGLSLLANVGMSTVSYVIGDIVKSLIKWFLGFNNSLRHCPAPDVEIRPLNPFIFIEDLRKSISVSPFAVCVVSENGLRAYTRVKWEILPAQQAALMRYGIRTKTEKGIIRASDAKQCQRVKFEIDPKYIPEKIKSLGGTVEVPVTVLIRMQAFEGIKIMRETAYIRYSYSIEKKKLLKPMPYGEIWISYTEGESGSRELRIKNLANRTVEIRVERGATMIKGLNLEYPSTVGPNSVFTLRVTSSGLPPGHYLETIKLITDLKTEEERVKYYPKTYIDIIIDVRDKEGKQPGGEEDSDSGWTNPGGDHPDDNFDVPRLTLTREKDLYSLLREGLKKNITEASDLLELASYHAVLHGLTAENASTYRDVAAEMAKLYIKLSSDVSFLDDLEEKAPSVAVYAKGFYQGMENILREARIPYRLVYGDFDPVKLARYQRFLILPSGSLFGMNTPAFREKLRLYLENGGSLIVFDQQYGSHFSIIPGGLGGYGWAEDQMCHRNALYAAQDHPILSSVLWNVVTEDVDGYFEKYPPDAVVLLRRTKNDFPAMLMYRYGKGYVFATTLYSDWKSQDRPSGFILNILRDAIRYMEFNGDVYEVGTKKSWWGWGFRNDTYLIPINVTNPTDVAADGIKFMILTPQGEMRSGIEVNESLAPGESKTVVLEVSSRDFGSVIHGIWTVDYSLLSAGREIYTAYDVKGISINAYTDNDALFNYRGGNKYLFWVTSDRERVPFGEKARLTVHIINKADKTLSGGLGIGHHINGWHVLEVKNVSVAPGEYRKYTFEVYPYIDAEKDFRGLTYYFGLYTSKSPYEGGGNFYDAFLKAEKGVHVIYPNVHITAKADKSHYAPNETMNINVTVTNSDDLDWELLLAVRLYEDRNVIASISNITTIPRSSTITIPIKLKMPQNASPGYHYMVVELADRYGKLLGSLMLPRDTLSVYRSIPSVELSSEFTAPLGLTINARITNNVSMAEPRLLIREVYSWNGRFEDRWDSFHLNFTNWEAEVRIPLREDIFGKYSVFYELYDGNWLVSSGSARLVRNVRVIPEVRFSGRVFSNLTLLVSLINPGFLDEDFNLTVDIPSINYTSTTPVHLPPKGNRTVNLTVRVPLIQPGTYRISIRAWKNKGSIEKSEYFRVLESDVRGRIHEGPYSTGDEAYAVLENRGGIPANIRGNISIVKNDRAVAVSTFGFPLNPGENSTVSVRIPDNMTPGAIIVLNFTDLTANRTESVVRPLNLMGMKIVAVHPARAYALDNITVTLRNDGGMSDTASVTLSLRYSLWGSDMGARNYSVSLAPGESLNVTFEVPNLPTGEYVFLVTAHGELSSSTYWDYLHVIGPNLSVSVAGDVYSAGDNITAEIRNSGGGYRNLRITGVLRKGHSEWYLGERWIEIGKLESKNVTFPIPRSLSSGSYTLVLYYGGVYTKNITVRGLELNVSIAKESYDVDEDIELKINNTGGTTADLEIRYRLSSYSGSLNITVASGTSRTVTLEIPNWLPDGPYELRVLIHDRFTNLYLTKTFEITVRGAGLEVIPLKTDLEPNENLPVRLINTGGIELNLTMTLSVSGVQVNGAVAVPKGGSVDYTFTLPPLTKGEHDVILSALDGNSGRRFSESFRISVSGFRINATVSGTSFAVGDTLTVELTSGSGADAVLDYVLAMEDMEGNSFLLKVGTLTLPAGGRSSITAKIPRVALGNYTLTLRMVERSTGERFTVTKLIHIEGLWGELYVEIPRHAFIGSIPLIVNVSGNTNGTLRITGNASIDAYPTRILGIEMDGGIWVAFSTHLGHYSDGSMELFGYPNGTVVEGGYEGGSVPIASSGEKIWVASSNRILQFDKESHVWRTYNTSGIEGFPAYVTSFWGEEQVNIFTMAYYNGSLWVGTDNAGIVVIDPGNMSVIRVYNSTNSPLESDYITMLKVNGSDLWAIGANLWKIGNGWEKYSPETFGMTHIDAVEVFGDQVWVGGGSDSGTFACVMGGECVEVPAWRIANIEHDNISVWFIYPPWGDVTASRYFPSNGTLLDYSGDTFWGNLVEIEDGVYASSYGLMVGGELHRFGPRGTVIDIAYHDGKAYLLTENGISIYDMENGSWEDVISDKLAWGGSIAYAGGRLFVATWSGIAEYDPSSGTVTLYDSSNSPFSYERSPTSMAGRGEMLYVGTSNGLVVLNTTSGSFAVYDFNGNGINDVWVSGDEVWIAWNGGAGIYDVTSGTYEPYLEGETASLVRAYDDEVWVAFQQGGEYALWHYDRSSGTAEVYNSTDGLTGDYISDMARSGGLLFVTYSYGNVVSVFDGSSWGVIKLPVSSVESSGKEVLFGGALFAVYSKESFEFPVVPGRNELSIDIEKPGEHAYAFKLMLGKQVLDEELLRVKTYEHAISFDLTTPKRLYKRGENVTLDVTIRNYASLDDTVSYVLSLGNELYRGNVSVGAAEEVHLSFTVRTEESFNATLTVNGESKSIGISVVEPEGEITLDAPDVVGYDEPFNATLRITNTGEVPLELSVEFEGSRNITVMPGDSVIIARELRTTDDMRIIARISGDLNVTLEKDVRMGERVELRFSNITAVPGLVEVPFTVRNSGILDSHFTLTFRRGNWSSSMDVSVPAGAEINMTLPLELTEGNYTYTYETKFGSGSFRVEVIGERLSITHSFDGQNLTLNVSNHAPLDFFGTLKLESRLISNVTNLTVPAGSWRLLSFPVGELRRGNYSIRAEIERDGRRVLERILEVRAEPVISLSIGGVKDEYRIGETLNATVRVRNTGTAGEESLLVVEVPGIHREEMPLRIGLNGEKIYNITFELPEDLPSMGLSLRAVLGNVTVEKRFHLRGVNLSVALSTDREWYYEDENVTVTLTLTNHENVTLRGNVTLSCGAFSTAEDFELGMGMEMLNFTFPACPRVFYQVALSTGRLIHIDSRLIQIKERDAVVTLITDKERYHVGDEMTIYITSTKPVQVSLAVFNNATVVNVTKNATVSFRVPDVESGTYRIYYSYGNETLTREFDVVSPGAKILSFELEKQLFEPGENISFSALVHAEEDVVGKVVVWLYRETSLVDYYSQPLNLTAGDNRVDVTTDITVPNVGTYTLVYAFYRGLNSTVIASGSQSLQTTGALITSMTTDRERYTEAEKINLTLVITGTPGTYMLRISGIEEVLERNVTINGTEEMSLALPARLFDNKIVAELLMGNYSTSRQIRVEVTNLPPSAYFEVRGNVSVNSTLLFDASLSTDPGNDSLTYSWDFGDGTALTSSSPTVSHVYTAEGNYTVTLVVSDGEGSTDMALIVLEISAAGAPRNVTVVSREGAFRKLTMVAQVWTFRYLYYRTEYEELIARARELEVDNESLAAIMMLHEEAEMLIVAGWRAKDVAEVLRIWTLGSRIPNIIKVRRAYLLEKEAVKRLKDLLGL